MTEQDLFTDQGIPTQQPAVFQHPTHGDCWITQDPAEPAKLYPDHVAVMQCQLTKPAYAIEPIHRVFIVPRTTLKA